jgi:hypothetical protein
MNYSFRPALWLPALVVSLTSCTGLGSTHEASRAGGVQRSPTAAAGRNDSARVERWLHSLRSPDESARGRQGRAGCGGG